jgi:general secretion pathway protein I
MSPRTSACRSDRGFTLVEILVALMIFSLVLLPLTAVLVSESKFERSYQRKLVAMLVAKNEMEKTKAASGFLEDGDYIVEMAGRRWNVSRTLENSEVTLTDGTVKGQHGFITIRVGRENDTAVLADLRVMKETYR